MKSLGHFHTPLTDYDTLIDGKRKEELVKMMIQTLDNMGFKQTVEKLVEESKVAVEDEPLTRFGKRILEGNWDEALKNLEESNLTPEQKKRIVFLINEQKYIELILNKQYNEGLLLLRSELVQNCEESERLKKLATILTCSTPQEVEEKLNIKLDVVGVRQELLNTIEKECKTKQITAANRLDKLLHQAISFQFVSCKYHEKKDGKISLLEDHACQIEAFPSKPYIGCLEHSEEVIIVKFSNKGDLFATVTRGNDLCIWKFNVQPFAPTLKHKITKIHDKQVNSINWSPNDIKILTASSDKKVKIWDIETGSLLFALVGHNDIVSSAIWIPGSRNFISGGLDNFLIIWNIKGEEVARIGSSRVIDLLVSSDGRKLFSVAASHPKVAIIDLINQTEIAQIKEDSTICAASLSKDNQFLLTLLSGPTSVLHLWDIEKNRLIQAYEIFAKENLKFGCCFGGTGDQFMACGSEDGTIRIWHRNQTKPVIVLKSHSSVVNSLSWHPTNPHILISASDDRSLCIWVSDYLQGRLKNGLGLETEEKSFEIVMQEEGKAYEDLLYDLEEEDL